jgi:hypothetical protein
MRQEKREPWICCNYVKSNSVTELVKEQEGQQFAKPYLGDCFGLGRVVFQMRKLNSTREIHIPEDSRLIILVDL